MVRRKKTGRREAASDVCKEFAREARRDGSMHVAGHGDLGVSRGKRATSTGGLSARDLCRERASLLGGAKISMDAWRGDVGESAGKG